MEPRGMATWHTVLALHWHSPAVAELVLDRQQLAFTVGDCLSLGPAPEAESRPYSIASGTAEPVLRVLFRHLPGGLVSGFLARLRVGDRVAASPPFGWFRPGQDDPAAPAVFIATGTGIAPFLSYLRSSPRRLPAALLYGARQRQDLVATTELAAAAPPRLAVSRESAPGCHRGRVTDLLPALALAPGTHYYLCGLEAMIDEVAGWLEGHGVDYSCIHREVFFHAPSPAA